MPGPAGVSATVVEAVEIGQYLVVPVDLGAEPHPRMVDDQIVGASLVGPAAIQPVVQRRFAGPERGDAILQVAAQYLAVQIRADGQREIYRIGPDIDLGERLVPQGAQFAVALLGDLVDGARGQSPGLFGTQRPDQSLVLHAMQSAVQRSGFDPRPQVRSVQTGIAAQPMPVHGASFGQRGEDEEPGFVHQSSLARVLAFEYPTAMAIRPILIAGDPRLSAPAVPVTVFDAELAAFVDDLFDTNAAANGAAVAANQVGDPRAVFAYDLTDHGVRHRGHVVNPMIETSEIPETMPDPDDDLEGCLSVPGEWFPTGRADWARVTGVDVHGEPVTVEGTGYLARCLQHETDHLAGRLYLQRLIGRNHRAARRMIRDHGWTEPGRSWLPDGPTRRTVH